MLEHLLENLNPQQAEAVTHKNGPLMIIAGAGTGKTTVITRRIAWLIDQNLAKPDEILALTFTEKAASEMEERVDNLLPMGYLDLWISTFHSFGERILSEYGLEIGLPQNAKLLTEVDALLLIRQQFDRFSFDYYKPRGNPGTFIKSLLSYFSRLKDEMITPEIYLKYVEEKQGEMDTAEAVASEEQELKIIELKKQQELADAYHLYQEILLELQSFDFGDLMLYTYELLKKRPNILAEYQNKFKFMLVDEFQDTNTIQYEIVKLLAGQKANITIVGDDDQSIYKFRGASLQNILQFSTDFPETKKIVLTKNYRSKKAILETSYELIQQNNPHRLEIKESINKQLEAHQEGSGIVEHIHAKNLDEEVNLTVKKILEKKNDSNCSWGDFCILVRANDSAKPFIKGLEQVQIPYRFLAMSGLYIKPIIVDILSYLRIIDQPHESPSLFRILSHPTLGIPAQDLNALTLYCKKKARSLYQAMQDARIVEGISEEGLQKIEEILAVIAQEKEKSQRLPASEFFVELMKVTGLLGYIRMQEEVDQQEQFGYLQQLYERIKKFENFNDDTSLHNFLQEFDHERSSGGLGSISLDPEQGPDVVNIMTIHSSKGLEFEYVFIVNLVEQKFPSRKKSNSINIPVDLLQKNEDDDMHLAEERRLFYVAMTRAKEGLFLLSADDYGGKRKRKISRFLEDVSIEKNEQKIGEDLFTKNTPKEMKKKQIMHKLPKSFSFTQIAAFSNCPLQYKFAHILKVPVFGRHNLSFGKTMHNTLQHFAEEILASKNKMQTTLFDSAEEKADLPDLKALMSIYEEQWINEWYPDEKVKDEYYQLGKGSLKEYYSIIKKQPPNIAYLEKGFTLKIKDIAMKGRIDRIDFVEDGVEIIDYKTGKPKTSLGWQEKRQLILYQLAAEECFDPPLKVKKLTYHYLEDNSFVSFEAKEKEKDKLKHEIIDTIEIIRSSNFDPKPNAFTCGYCDFKDICEFSQA